MIISASDWTFEKYQAGEYGDHCIIHGDCRDVLPKIPDKAIDLVLTDPPYGISHPTNYRSRGRSALANCKDYPAVYDDDKPFDPKQILDFGVPTILWGANYYADKLPISSGWLVWDKERPDDLDQSTCELAWSNCVKGCRRIKYLWHGMIRKGDETLVHPTQKPVDVMAWAAHKSNTTGIILDPFLGSGTTLVAAKNLGRRAIGIEINYDYCKIAEQRLAQEVLAL